MTAMGKGVVCEGVGCGYATPKLGDGRKQFRWYTLVLALRWIFIRERLQKRSVGVVTPIVSSHSRMNNVYSIQTQTAADR